jgi:hypothetical protein
VRRPELAGKLAKGARLERKLARMERILTMLEFEALYKVGRASVRKMLKNGQLEGIRTPSGWRICDPGPALFRILRNRAAELERVPFIRGSEVALLLGISPRRVRQVAENGTIACYYYGRNRVYALFDVLDLVASRERGKRGSGKYARTAVLLWAAKRIAETSRNASEI